MGAAVKKQWAEWTLANVSMAIKFMLFNSISCQEENVEGGPREPTSKKNIN